MCEFNMPLIFNFVSQETFLHELARAEKYFLDAGKFVGLSHFIKGHLGPMGYDYRQSIRIADWLQAIGKIEFYKVKPPAYDVEITAVRLKTFSKLFAATLWVPPHKQMRLPSHFKQNTSLLAA